MAKLKIVLILYKKLNDRKHIIYLTNMGTLNIISYIDTLL